MTTRVARSKQSCSHVKRHRAIIEKLRTLSSFAEPKTNILLSKFKKLGLFSDEAAEARGNLLDTLCARLENLMQYESNEVDLVYLQHTFIVERADGKVETITSVLDEQGSPNGYSAMARLVGVPCGIAVDLVLRGVIKTPGVLAPYDIDVSVGDDCSARDSRLTNGFVFGSSATNSKRSLKRSTSRWSRRSSRRDRKGDIDVFAQSGRDGLLFMIDLKWDDLHAGTNFRMHRPNRYRPNFSAKATRPPLSSPPRSINMSNLPLALSSVIGSDASSVALLI